MDLPPGLLGIRWRSALPALAVGGYASGGSHSVRRSTQVGVYRIRWFDGKESLGPIVNVVPEAGQSAEFVLENEITYQPGPDRGIWFVPQQGYAFDGHVESTSPGRTVSAEMTFWGVPADPSHNMLRDLFAAPRRSPKLSTLLCSRGLVVCPWGSTGSALGGPTDCSEGSRVAVSRGDSWEEPGHVEDNQRFVGYQARQAVPPCCDGARDLLAFDPSVEVRPREYLADAPVGVGVDIKVPQPESAQTLDTPTS